MKRALIVDDSRLARHVLGRLLTQHGVQADTAESAEAALEYLKSCRPDVVFLDHQMPGIDGLEALEEIKKNPSTATIPVMMYTSREGEVYLGQARALGAIGVLPKSVAPVEVTKVLRSLHLIPSDGEPASAPVPAPEPMQPRQLRQLIEEVLYEHGATLRDELSREVHAAVRGALAPPPAPVPAMELPAPKPAADVSRRYKVASVLLLATAALFAYLFFTTQGLLTASYERAGNLVATTSRLASGTGLLSSQPAPKPGAGTLEVLQWGFNQGGAFAFGDVPFGDSRASALTTLVAELDRLGFAGTLALDVHVGRFCMSAGANGELEPAAPAQPATMCEQVGWADAEAVRIGQGESLSFAYALANAERRYPRIRIDKVFRGTASPAVPYPSPYAATAGEWNKIAARNQRVELRLTPL
jgi:CheY-like chemotaxis protein